MNREIGGCQPVIWPARERTEQEEPIVVRLMTNKERRKATRQADEAGLDFLMRQIKLYPNSDSIPVILKRDADLLRLRLAITGRDGRKLPAKIAEKHITALMESGKLHDNGVANKLITSVKTAYVLEP